MLSENKFMILLDKAKGFKYTSMTYIEFNDCKNADIIADCEALILLRDNSKTPAMLYYATDDLNSIVDEIDNIHGKLRLHFVPRAYVELLINKGFSEWGEYCDFWNTDLLITAKGIGAVGHPEYLENDRCGEASVVSRKCRLQSRGFEGETAEWFAEWLKDNKVIITQNVSGITGYCCVSIYNEGTTLWIREIGVDPAYQGMGLGKKLIEQAVLFGVENGAVKGFLSADIHNKNAIGLYNKYGFYSDYSDSELQMIRGGDSLSPSEILSNKANLICICPETDCEWHGNCKDCIALHRYHATIPNCLEIELKKQKGIDSGFINGYAE